MKKQNQSRARSIHPWLACALTCLLPLSAAENPAANGSGDAAAAATAPASAQDSEIEQLKKMLLDQQRQIDALRQTIADQQKKSGDTPAPVRASTLPVTAPETPHPSLGQVASAAPMIPPKPEPAFVPQNQNTSSSANPCDATGDNAVPPYLRLGSVCIVPIGFMDLTAVWRDKDTGSSIGSNFGSVPYNNVAGGKNPEFRFSPQNSRIGFRIDGDWKGTHFIGYNEFDFLGTSGSNSITVTNGAFVPRLRLFWVDARKGKLEFLAGQSWSMLTPNRSGISALPGDLFYSQSIDVNYMAGLTWTRQPGMRLLYHATKAVTAGVSVENPDSYIGGSGGGSSIVLPSALSALGGTQLDNGSSVLSAATYNPDIIAKIAVDPSSRFHVEVAGIERTFKDWNPNTGTALGAGLHSTKVGGGVQLGANVEIFKNFRLISTNYWSDGGGRYLFGQAPDLIVRADGSLSLIHSGGTVDGFETRFRNILLYAYYGGILIGKDTALDANGTSLIGYGYAGSANSQNHMINEISFGFNQTIWADPRYGAINAMGQYEYLDRNPWYVAAGAPKATHDNTIYFDLRYTLPGAMPKF